MRLQANGPINLEHTLGSGQAFRWRREGEWHCGVVGDVLFKVRQAGEGVEFRSTSAHQSTAAPLLRSYLRLDDDLPGIYRRLRRDARMARAIRLYPGLRLLRQEPWECLVGFVVSAWSNIPRIAGHMEELARTFGNPITLEGLTGHTFPSPGRLAEVGEPWFRERSFGFRSKYLARLPEEVLKLGVGLESLRAVPYGEARAIVLGLPGVGEKVADCVLAFSLDKLEAFPVDVWVRRAVQEWYFGGQRQTDRALRQWAAEHFGPHAGYAQQYLFHQRRLDGRSRPGGVGGRDER